MMISQVAIFYVGSHFPSLLFQNLVAIRTIARGLLEQVAGDTFLDICSKYLLEKTGGSRRKGKEEEEDTIIQYTSGRKLRFLSVYIFNRLQGRQNGNGVSETIYLMEKKMKKEEEEEKMKKKKRKE